jgi:hypothetical protein
MRLPGAGMRACCSGSVWRIRVISLAVLGAGIEVVMADVLNDATAALYRRLVPSVVIVRLHLPLREARRRATLRPDT